MPAQARCSPRRDRAGTAGARGTARPGRPRPLRRQLGEGAGVDRGGQGARRASAGDRGDGARAAGADGRGGRAGAPRPRPGELDDARGRPRRRPGGRRRQAAGREHGPLRRGRDRHARGAGARAGSSGGGNAARGGRPTRWASSTGSTRRPAGSSSSRGPGSPSRRSPAQFRQHTVHRRYLAIAHGDVRSRTIRSFLVEDRGDGLRGSARGTPRRASAREAITHVERLEALRGATLVACRLETGRTHQIRIHLSEAGHPLVGERVYIAALRGAAPRGAAPHAPRGGARVRAPGDASARCAGSGRMPEDMAEVLERLRLGR